MAVHSDISVRFKPVPQGPEGFDEIDSAGPYTTQQNQFMELVKSQDVFEVRKFIISNENFDVNENNVGRAALRFAIDYNDLKMIDFLVKETSLKVGGSLFTAVREGSKDCVEKLMRPPSRTGATPQDEGYIGPEDVIKNSYMSPLMLAVHLEEHEIVELFVSCGYRIQEPSIDDGDNSKNKKMPVTSSTGPPTPTGHISDSHRGQAKRPSHAIERELSFLRRINAYKALANPIYLAYTYIYYDPNKDDKRDLHPIYQIFELNGKLDGMAKEYYEFKVRLLTEIRRGGTGGRGERVCHGPLEK